MDRASAGEVVNQASQTDTASLSLQQPRATTYRYDDLNRLIEVIPADGTRTTYTYDAAGNLTQTTTDNPLPALTNSNPNQALVGSSAFTLTVNGMNFVPGAVVRVNGNDRPTTFVNNTQLTAAIPASDIAAAGAASITVFNPAPGGGSSTALNFTITRVVRVVDANGATGSQVNVAVELVAQGNENALGFSLTFDPAILGNPQVALGSGAAGAALNLNLSQIAQGRIGVGLALPAGQMFAAGVRQLVVASFNIAVGATANSTPIGFGDQPIVREVVDANANSLTTAYTPGMVAITIAPGFEADVAPRPNGDNNGTVTIADWAQAGRFATGLDTPATGGEFQRADCAPKETKGNSQLTIADWAQAGRYAVGLDAVVPAGGPTGPFSLALSFASTANTVIEAAADRVLRAVNTSFTRGQNGSLSIELEAQGNENAFGFSLTFDPSQLSFVSAASGNDVPSGAGFNINANQAASGRLVIALALPAGGTFAAGTRRVVTVTFAAASSGSANSTAIGFGDQPMAREVVDAQANTLPTTYVPGAATLIRTAVSVSAANYTAALASESIVAAFGTNLATATEAATALPLPTALAGTSVKIKDSTGAEQPAPLFFVSFGQVNYHIPPGTAPGTATITITSGDGAVSTGTIEIVAVAPGLFTFNADGRGVPAGYALRLRQDQLLPPEPIAQLDAQNRWVTRPLDLGPESDQVFLVLFGTGFRYRSSLAAVMAGIGGTDEQVLYAGIAPGFIGLDQSNLRLSRRLIGRGEVEVVMMVDGRAANTVRVNIK